MADAPRKVRVLAVNVFPVGPTYTLHRDEDGSLEIRCTQGVLRAMLDHARKGLTRDKGGLMEREPTEVKGFLLGRVEQMGKRLVVVVERTVELPPHALDQSDAAYFTAADHVLLEQKQRKYDGGQVVGYYHSHPRHRVRASEQDIRHFRENLTEPYQLAAIVGPAESSTGFFLQRGLDGYAAGQEPEFSVEYDGDGMPVIDTELAEFPSESPGRPPVRAKARSWRGLSVLAALLALVAVTVALLIYSAAFRPESVPVVRLSDHDLELDQQTPRRTISLSLGSAGACDFTVRTEEGADWLEVAPAEGELEHPDVAEITVSADMSRIEAGDTLLSHLVVVSVPRVEGAEAQATTIPVRGSKNVRLVEQRSDWRLGAPRVDYDGLDWDLSGCPLEGDDVRVRVALSTSDGRSETTVFTREAERARLRVASGDLPSPLDWSTLRLEARASQDVEHADRIVAHSCVGAASLDKRVRDWALPPPEIDGGVFTFATLPLPTTAHWMVEVDEGNGWRGVNRGVLATGRSVSHAQEYGPALRELRIRAAFVGEHAVYEYRYVFSFSGVERRDVAFDRTQGAHGRAFRANHPERYEASGAALLGEIGGPRHYEDLDAADRVGWVLITKNRRVHEDSWGRLKAVGDELESAGHGRFAWYYHHGDERIMLVFVMADDRFQEHCEALVSYPEVLNLTSIASRRRLSIRPPAIEDEDAFNLGTYRIPRDGGS